jgi:hypothetical protein
MKMKSYIKLLGPPISKALKALETVAIDMPEVCIMSPRIETILNTTGVGFISGPGHFDDVGGIMSYFGTEIPEERCSTIISESGETLGEYDFYFEWFKDPNMGELINLIEKIDDALMEIDVKYTITTK